MATTQKVQKKTKKVFFLKELISFTIDLEGNSMQNNGLQEILSNVLLNSFENIFSNESSLFLNKTLLNFHEKLNKTVSTNE